jgi:hypothetical protein
LELSTEYQLFFPQTKKIKMTSRSLSGGVFIHPESSLEDSTKDKSLNYRHPTVYDAVAGNYYLPSKLSLCWANSTQAGFPLEDSFQSTS